VNRLDAAMRLVTVDSVSRNESALAGIVEAELRANPLLDVERIGDNVVARTTGHHATRLLVAGHLDTVPGDPAAAVIEGERLIGLGACDMKGSLSVMLELARRSTPRPVEITWVFYAREEIARAESGLLEIGELRPDLLQADAAVLCEPTGGRVEAGCQGTLRVSIALKGARAHTARPFTGRNAIHRMAALVSKVASYEPRTVEIDGVAFTEQLQAVSVSGGVAPNVVPDTASCTLNHRVAPDRGRDEAMTWLVEFLDGLIEDGDSITVDDWAPGAAPELENKHLDELVRLTDQSPRGKVGWTDVATFSDMGIAATNFGAGNPLLAHRIDEFVDQHELDDFASVLERWLG